MYEKKQIIYSSTMGVVVVKDVTKLSPDRKAPVLYYVLRSFYDKEKVAYIPVEEHAVELRDLIDTESAEKELKALTSAPIREDEETVRRAGEIAYVLGKTPEEILNYGKV